MVVSATEFKAKCLSLIDRVHRRGGSITITKRGRVVARLTADRDVGDRPWLALRGKVTWYGDPLAPAVEPEDVDAYK